MLRLKASTVGLEQARRGRASPSACPVAGPVGLVHPQHGHRRDRRPHRGHRSGAAGLLSPRLVHLQGVV